MKQLIKYIKESILSQGFDISPDAARLFAAYNILKNMHTAKWDNTLKNLKKTFGKSYGSKTTRDILTSKHEQYMDGVVVLVVREEDPKWAYNISQNSNLIELIRFNKTSLYPDVLLCLFDEAGESLKMVVFNKRCARISWKNHRKYWILGPDNNGMLEDLEKILKSRN